MLDNKSPYEYFLNRLLCYLNQFFFKRYKSNSITQLGWLFWRSTLATIRDPMATKIQAIQTIVKIKS